MLGDQRVGTRLCQERRLEERTHRDFFVPSAKNKRGSSQSLGRGRLLFLCASLPTSLRVCCFVFNAQLTGCPMCVKGLWLVLFGLAASGVLQVSGMRVYTSGKIEAVNGTDVRLKCTFQSSATINPSVVVISWTFRSLTGDKEESLFHYQQKPYPPMEGIFRKRIQWAGDVMGGDASIIIQEVKFAYNGTYICQVKNPPDVHGPVGKIELRVVLSASFSELLVLVLAIGGAITAVVLVLIIVASCRRYKRRQRQRQLENNEEAPRKERKDPTVCHPSRTALLCVSETSIETDSSDGMISDPSTEDSSSSEDESSSSDDDDDSD